MVPELRGVVVRSVAALSPTPELAPLQVMLLGRVLHLCSPQGRFRSTSPQSCHVVLSWTGRRNSREKKQFGT